MRWIKLEILKRGLVKFEGDYNKESEYNGIIIGKSEAGRLQTKFRL